jgi:signal transduction histidine kinase
MNTDPAYNPCSSVFIRGTSFRNLFSHADAVRRIARRTAAATAARHGLWLGLGAAAVAACASLWFQYHALVRLEETMPAARRALLRERVTALAADLEEGFRSRALRDLSAPADVIRPGEDDLDRAFGEASAGGVKWYFLVSLDEGRRPEVALYNPRRRPDTRPRRPMRPAAAVARNASLQWMFNLARNRPVDPDTLASFEANPGQLAVIKPIVDASSRMVGVAGMIVDPRQFRAAEFPAAFDAAVARHLGPELDALSLTVLDAAGSLVRGPDPAGGVPEAVAGLSFPLAGWRVEARPRGPTPEELAARQFAIGVAQTLLVGLLLAGGAALTLRASSREIGLLRMKADFLSNVTHEFQSPLTAIRVYAELLKSGRVREQDRLEECATHLERESQRLGRLVNNILDFARMDAGRRGFRYREVDLAAVAREAVEAERARAERTGHRIELEAPAGLPPVAADAEALGQALANLLDNALKYSPAGSRVAVRVARAGGSVAVSVADEGPGIPRGEHERVFERFYRVPAGLTHDVKGSGIGLALVKHVVEAHRGGVTVESGPGRGATFTITLPTLAPAGRAVAAEA